MIELKTRVERDVEWALEKTDLGVAGERLQVGRAEPNLEALCHPDARAKRRDHVFGFSLPSALSMIGTRDAKACGGCLQAPPPPTQTASDVTRSANLTCPVYQSCSSIGCAAASPFQPQGGLAALGVAGMLGLFVGRIIRARRRASRARASNT